MSAKQNITLAIYSALLKKARAIAARRGRSVSSLFAEELRELVADDAAYTAARKRAFALFSTPLPLGVTAFPARNFMTDIVFVDSNILI